MSKNTKEGSKMRTSHQRSYSASELARNAHHFEAWSTYQRCEQASPLDIPEELRHEMAQLFRVQGRISRRWLGKPRKCSSGLETFLKAALAESPDLLSEATSREENEEGLEEASIVYHAWKRLHKMCDSNERWSEADYVANVYNIIRSPAVRESVYRVQCTVSLPQPTHEPAHPLNTDTVRVLNAKTATPDCTVFLPSTLTRALSQSSRSPYNVLKNHPAIANASTTATRGASFRYQSTPCAQLPDMPGFEFISSIWEDKKPVHTLADDAYRQNRIATASVARHLHSLRIKAPVIGLTWASGTVRAHVDWCEVVHGKPVVMSAPYTGGFEEDASQCTQPFHQWNLNRPSDILQVYHIIRNIDKWTCTGFHKRVVEGLSEITEDITHKDGLYHPWRWIPSKAPTLRVLKENNTTSITTTTTSGTPSPLQKKSKRRRRR